MNGVIEQLEALQLQSVNDALRREIRKRESVRLTRNQKKAKRRKGIPGY